MADSSILDRSRVKTIYIFNLSHLDIGFTGTQAEVAQISAETIDEAIRLCGEAPDYKWTIESLWQLEQWMPGKSPERIERLMSLVRSGRIGLCACYAGMHTANMGAEEMCRSLYFAERLRREYGVSITVAMQNDIPGYSWAYPQTFAKSGVKYFVTGVNNFIGAGADIPVKDRPFYWEGPDGSRVLTYICQDPGIKESGYMLGLWEYKWGPGGEAERTVPELLERLEEEQYPYDAIAIMAATGDNGGTTLAMTEGAQEWNAKRSTPRMVIATPDEFFSHMDAKYDGQFPVYKGDWSGLWDQSIHRTPHGVSLSRRAHDELPMAETLASLADILGLLEYPRSDIDTAWRNMITYDEHSGGGGWPGTVTKQQTDEGCAVALGHAWAAAERTSDVLRASMIDLSSSVKSDGNGIFVWNPLPSTRTGFVHITLNKAQSNRAFDLVDVSTGMPVSHQRKAGRIIFRAEDIPGLGYKTFAFRTPTLPDAHTPIRSAEAARAAGNGAGSAPVVAYASVIESHQVRVEVGNDGSVTSILDKQTGAEYVDRASRYGFGCLVSSGKTRASSVTIKTGLEHPLAASLIITDSKSPLAKTEITVYAGSPVIHFRHALDMRRIPRARKTGAGIKYDIAYPLDILDAALIFDTPAGLLNPKSDLMPKAHHIINVQHGGDITGPKRGMAFWSKEASLWEFGRINSIWGTPIPPESTELMMRLMEKHDLAEYKEGVGEYTAEPGAPDIRTYETAFLPHDPDRTMVLEFLLSQANPLQAELIAPNPTGALPASGQLIDINGKGFSLLTLKKAEDGRGYALRLMETAGRSHNVTMRSGLLDIRSADMLDNVENPIRGLDVVNGTVKIALHPSETVTIRLDKETN